MVAQCDFRGTQFCCGAIKDTATQTGAERASGFSFRDFLFYDPVSILFNNLILNAQLFEILRENVFREARLFLVEVNGHQRETDWCALLQITQDLQHGIAVFTPGEANHNAVAIFNHIEVSNSFAHVTTQTFLQFVQVVLFFFANFLILLHYFSSLVLDGANWEQTLQLR